MQKLVISLKKTVSFITSIDKVLALLNKQNIYWHLTPHHGELQGYEIKDTKKLAFWILWNSLKQVLNIHPNIKAQKNI